MKMSIENNNDDEGNNNDIENCDGVTVYAKSEAAKNLTAMGFPEGEVFRSLNAAKGNQEAALELLLNKKESEMETDDEENNENNTMNNIISSLPENAILSIRDGHTGVVLLSREEVLTKRSVNSSPPRREIDHLSNRENETTTSGAFSDDSYDERNLVGFRPDSSLAIGPGAFQAGLIDNKIDNLHPLEYDQEMIDGEDYENVDNDNVFDANVKPKATSRSADKKSMNRKKVLSIVAIIMIIFIGITIWLVLKLSHNDTSPILTMSPTPYNQYVTRNILMILFNSTSGDQWTSKVGWSSWNDYCSWDGIDCDENDEVVNLNLYNNNLDGIIPSKLDTLTKLTFLNLGLNALSGTIPTEIGKLTKLTSLNLGSNALSGTIPTEIGKLTKLTGLEIRNTKNSLTGTIPTEIGELTDMKFLLISNNRLEGTIPSQLGNLTKLNHLNLNGNRLTGPISSTIDRLTNLRDLSLHNNNLSGNFPEVLCDNKWYKNTYPMIDCDEIDCNCCQNNQRVKCSI